MNMQTLKDGTQVSTKSWKYLAKWCTGNKWEYYKSNFPNTHGLGQLLGKQYAQLWEYAISNEKFITPKVEETKKEPTQEELKIAIISYKEIVFCCLLLPVTMYPSLVSVITNKHL